MLRICISLAEGKWTEREKVRVWPTLMVAARPLPMRVPSIKVPLEELRVEGEGDVVGGGAAAGQAGRPRLYSGTLASDGSAHGDSGGPRGCKGGGSAGYCRHAMGARDARSRPGK